MASKYKKLDHREHVLTRPGMYIGSIENDVINTWVIENIENPIMIKKDIKIVPGLYKIFDEVVVNAIDHSIRLKQEANENVTKKIEIDIDKESGEISVYNDGEGIEIGQNEEGIYFPELIFGYLLTSTNYEEGEQRIIGGQNGIGAKACNIFSTSFMVETVDSKQKKIYKQTFSDNMSKVGKPSIKAYSKKPFTRITFTPDYKRFGMTKLTDDIYALFVKRCFDICALTDAKISVSLNKVALKIKSFEKYIDLYIGDKGEKQRVYEKIDDRWEICATYTNDIGFEQVSFVNGIATIKGGKHIDYISNQICTKLADSILKKTKTNCKTQIKNYLMLFVNCTIVNPTFDSQSKDALTTPYNKFGTKPEVSDKFISSLAKTNIVENVMNLCSNLDAKAVKKTDGKKSNKIYGLSKLDDANFAGTAKSKDCTLILTEGDSAKTMALSGIAEVGRNYYGVFPLRGKLLNVKDAAVKKICENEEIQNIKKILGLESGKDYKNNIDSLRYGRIMIMSDQDYDGSHIRGLIMNLFHTCWHSLLEQKNFIVSLLTPIIKATKNKETISFYNIVDYDKWAENINTNGWKIKYYKGLGTSNEKEAKEYFKNMHLINYTFTKDTDNSIDLAFNKKRSDDRKNWMTKYNPNNVINQKEVSFSDFINKELIHFSVYDVKRSIPSMVDGFKPSQRKILYSCFKRNLIEEIKVAQLAGYISEHAGYHHGEVSLQGAIVNMAQDFVGSNNINLLTPNGMFGSRRMGGKDASEARYIYTQINLITHKIFRKEDSKLLKYLNDDGFTIEPEYYLPIIPIVLINGACGIGTGFSTSIPCYNPKDIISSLKLLIKKEKLKKGNIIPWYRGFTGAIEKSGTNGYISKGRFVKKSENIVDITELPIGTWTADYKEFLDSILEKKQKVLKDFESQYTNTNVHFVLHFYPGELEKFDTDTFEKEFKLINKNLMTSNMHLFDENGVIKKYENVENILEDFYNIRYVYYQKRKESYIKELEDLYNEISEKIRFIKAIISKSNPLSVMNVSKVDIEKELDKQNFKKITESYNYLLNMPIYNLTLEKVKSMTEESELLENKMKDYKEKSIESIWIEELDELSDIL